MWVKYYKHINRRVFKAVKRLRCKGRNTANKVVVFPKENFQKGQYVNVLVESCYSVQHLWAKLLNNNEY
jgi:hypothetical protein